MAIDGQDDDLSLYLGLARNAELLEIVTIVREDDTELTIHAMAKKAYGKTASGVPITTSWSSSSLPRPTLATTSSRRYDGAEVGRCSVRHPRASSLCGRSRGCATRS
jgi:hypothetical protein